VLIHFLLNQIKMRSTYPLFLSIVFFLFSCSDDDEATPDPRLALVGSYNMTSIDVNVSQGSLQNNFPYNTNSVIELTIDENLGRDKMLIELEDFLEESLTDYYEFFGGDVNIQVSFLEPQQATIVDRTFTVSNLDFEFVVYFNSSAPDQYWHSEINMEAVVTESDITINYLLVGRESNVTTTFDGVASGSLME